MFNRAMRRFVKSVVAGAAVAGLIPFAFLLALMLSADFSGLTDGLQFLAVAAMLLVVPFATVLAAAALVGLPTAYVLQRFNLESAPAYIIAGASFGFLIPWVYFATRPTAYDPSAWLSVPGAVAGAVTAYAWWRYRPDAPAAF
jgi:hypothetical protein